MASQPRVGIDKSTVFTWPHVEEDGLLCLAAKSEHRDPVRQTRCALKAGYELISASVAGDTRAHFQDEFLSYWSRHLVTKELKFLSLISPSGPSRKIMVWRGTGWHILGDDEESVLSWLRNRFEIWKQPPEIEPAALLWLPEPLFPNEYPRTASQIWGLAKERTNEGAQILRELAVRSQGAITVLIGSESKHGPCLAGVTVSGPKRTLPGRRGSTIENGFRKGHVPPNIISDRYWTASSPVLCSEVSRADAPWVHGRGHDVHQERLSKATVIVIGSGSLGAPVTAQLAMAGIGNLVSIDPEELTYANVGRHPLGANLVGRNKADALTGELKEKYPHHESISRPFKWQDVTAGEPKLFAGASLIVSATASWDAEDALNTWHLESGRTPPIIYGWTEEHACAGHAVLIAAGNTASCLACGFKRDGTSKLRLTRWPGDMLQQEPGCGALYQPYGPVELAHTVNLVSELALDALLGNASSGEHRMWACRKSFLDNAGGRWSAEWLALCNNREEGGFFFSRSWPRSADCFSCATAS